MGSVSGSRDKGHVIARRIVIIVGLCFVVVGAIWLRVYSESRNAYEQGIACMDQADRIRAVTFFDRALHWYAPCNPYVERAAQRLWEIAARAEEEEDPQLAAIALRSIRRGFIAGQSIYLPGMAWIEKAEQKLSMLNLKKEQEDKRDSSPEKPHSGQNRPDTFWTLILELGLVGWVFSVVAFLLYGLKGEPPQILGRRQAAICGMSFLLFYGLWIIGMKIA